MVAVGVMVSGIEDIEGDLGEIFCCRYDVENDGLVIRQARQKVAHRLVAAIHQDGVIPRVNQLFLGDAFDIGEVHHHALFR